jgi:DNA-binding CsgD family transcriptional regulator
METWTLETKPANHDFSNVIAHIGDDHFGNTLLRSFDDVTEIDFFSVYSLDQSKKPRMFLSGSKGNVDVSAQCFKKYLSGIYSRDHTFDEAKSLSFSNKTALTHWHESEFPKDHRTAIYSSFNILDRLSIVDATPNQEIIAINFYRHQGKSLFSENDVDVIQNRSAQILASVRKHIQIGSFSTSPKLSDEINIQDSLKSLYPDLSDRELQICSGLLMGRTYEGIASDLGISLATVKTYRARAYEKLGIHFKSELFGTAKLLVLRELKNKML